MMGWHLEFDWKQLALPRLVGGWSAPTEGYVSFSIGVEGADPAFRIEWEGTVGWPLEELIDWLADSELRRLRGLRGTAKWPGFVARLETAWAELKEEIEELDREQFYGASSPEFGDPNSVSLGRKPREGMQTTWSGRSWDPQDRLTRPDR